jgi:hypothetical protein
LPIGQVTAGYLRLLITAFPPAGGNPGATPALVQLGWDGHAVGFPQPYYPATLPDSATANTTSAWQNDLPTNAFSGGPGGTSWRQISGAAGNTRKLTRAVNFGAPQKSDDADRDLVQHGLHPRRLPDLGSRPTELRTTGPSSDTCSAAAFATTCRQLQDRGQCPLCPVRHHQLDSGSPSYGPAMTSLAFS